VLVHFGSFRRYCRTATRGIWTLLRAAVLVFGAIAGTVGVLRFRDNRESMVVGMGTVTETGESGGVMGTANGFGTGAYVESASGFGTLKDSMDGERCGFIIVRGDASVMGFGTCSSVAVLSVGVVLALLAGDATTSGSLGIMVFVAILAKRSLSKSPTMLS